MNKKNLERTLQIIKEFKGNVEWTGTIDDDGISCDPLILLQYEKAGKVINGDAKEYIRQNEPDLFKLIDEDFIVLSEKINNSLTPKVTPIDLDALKNKCPEIFEDNPFLNKEPDFIKGDECWYKGKITKDGQQSWNVQSLSNYLKQKGN
jgi:hypothetical protein